MGECREEPVHLVPFHQPQQANLISAAMQGHRRTRRRRGAQLASARVQSQPSRFECSSCALLSIYNSTVDDVIRIQGWFRSLSWIAQTSTFIDASDRKY